MACSRCEQHWFFKKLGRCRQCMLLSLGLSLLLGLSTVFYQPSEAVYGISLRFAFYLSATLSLAHGLMWLYYRYVFKPETHDH